MSAVDEALSRVTGLVHGWTDAAGARTAQERRTSGFTQRFGAVAESTSEQLRRVVSGQCILPVQD